MINNGMLKLWCFDLLIPKRWFLKYDVKFSNVILGPEKINFNGFQNLDA